MTDATQNSETAPDDPSSGAVLLSQAAAQYRAGRLDLAEPLFDRLLDQNPDHPRALAGKAICLSHRHRQIETALDLLTRAVACDPDDAYLHQTLAATRNSAGDFPGAVDAARQALTLDPLCALAYVNLTDSTKITPDDPVFALGQTALTAPDLDETDRGLIHFALAKAHQDCRDWDAAFAHFQAGNDLKHETRDFTPFRDVAERQKTLFSPDYCRGIKGIAKTNPRPIFVIGMPRSGTTLLERMLVAHSDVSTAGERREMRDLSADFFAKSVQSHPDLPPHLAIRKMAGKDNLAQLAKAYVTRLTRAADAPLPNIIDKMPMNFWNVGIIAAIFRNAPILHMRRHPLDTCLSNYFANFQTGLGYSNRLTSLGQYFRLYDEMMRHWHHVFPGRILDVSYEALVSDPEREIRRILDHIGLEWQQACVHPESAKGMIATASRWQARQKINTASIEKWRRYQSHIDPLITALGGMGWIHSYMQSDTQSGR